MRFPVRRKGLRVQFTDFNLLFRGCNGWRALMDYSYSRSSSRLPSQGICHSHSTQTVHYLPWLFLYLSHGFFRGSTFFFKQKKKNIICIIIYYILNFTVVDSEAENVFSLTRTFSFHFNSYNITGDNLSSPRCFYFLIKLISPLRVNES